MPSPRCSLCRGSIKLDKLLEVLPEELNGEEEVEVKTSLMKTGNLVPRANGFNFVLFDGSLTPKARTEAIEAFSKPSPNAPTIFLMSLKAGGFIVEDSVEERMLKLQYKKRKLMQGAFSQKLTGEEKRQARIKYIKWLLDL